MAAKTYWVFFVYVVFLFPNILFAQPSDVLKVNEIHMIYMGGDDCPPCVNWRKFELPKLEATEVFKRIKLSRVVKPIRSGIPASFFLPNDVKPYKDKLDMANNTAQGSPQTAILVNGDVYDYYFGVRDALEVEKMLLSIEAKTPYPFERCVKLTPLRKCEVKG